MHIAQIVLLIARFILIVALFSVNWSCIKTGTVKIFFMSLITALISSKTLLLTIISWTHF